MNVDRRKVMDWLEAKWKGEKKCPICQGSSWSIGEHIFETRVFHEGAFVIGSPAGILPSVMVVCQVCGHTLMFNAVIAKLIESNTQGKDPEEAKHGHSES